MDNIEKLRIMKKLTIEQLKKLKNACDTSLDTSKYKMRSQRLQGKVLQDVDFSIPSVLNCYLVKSGDFYVIYTEDRQIRWIVNDAVKELLELG